MSEDRPSHNDLYKQIGLLEGKVESLRRDINDMQRSNIAMAADVKAMRSQLDQTKGGKMALVGLLGAAATAGAVLSHAVGFIRPG